jgi:hypothetical protein
MKNIYYLKWNNRSLLLHEEKDQELISRLDNEELRILYGNRLAEEDLRSIKTSLKISIERGVNRWISDSRFLLHCVMAAGVFLVSYYFLSYVVRDPLPLVDEIILSLLLGILAYFRLNNQEYKSERAVGRKLELEQSLADMPCEGSSFLGEVELYLEKLDAMDDRERRDLTESGGVPVFFSADKKELLRLYKAARSGKRSLRRSYPAELKVLMDQIGEYLKYHSSMV